MKMKERKVNYLSDILPGERAVIGHLETKGDMRRRLLDIGLTENTVVECVGKSPLGDPSAYLIRGVIAIRVEDGGTVRIKEYQEAGTWD